MCGIAGVFEWREEQPVIARRIDAMCQAIIHRGPDDQGSFVAPGIGLGMRRLSIIDVAGGHQPIDNEDGSIQLVFNGEIYNFQHLRQQLVGHGHRFKTRTDTEVIVHGYEQTGLDSIADLNGMFGFALWDGKQRRLVLARDRMGIKPLYYTETALGWAFASEIKALLTLPGVERVLDLNAAAQFFRLGFVPAPLTLFRGIRRLPAGSILVAQDGGVELRSYWELEFDRGPERTFEECREELSALLGECVRDQMVSDVPLGAFLSGGVDSSALVAHMSRAATHQVRTFSIGFDAEHSYHNEAPYAEAAAKSFGALHQTIVVKPDVANLIPQLVEKLDEPLTDTAFINSYLVSELARRDVTVSLSGLGGDELFGGYRRYLGPAFQRTVAWIPETLRQKIGRQLDRSLTADRGSVAGNLGRYGKALGRTLHMPPAEQYLGLLSVLSTDYVNSLLSPVRTPNGDPGSDLISYYSQAKAVDAEDRLLFVDAKTVLPESLLLLSDKMGMAVSLEVRVPFLDNRLVDFVAGLPSRYRFGPMALKRLLKSSLQGLVPDFVLKRSKRGFGMPIGTWLRTDLRPLVDRLLEPGQLRSAGIFDPAVVRRILDTHDSRREDFTEPIVALLIFEIWRERFKVRLP